MKQRNKPSEAGTELTDMKMNDEKLLIAANLPRGRWFLHQSIFWEWYFENNVLLE